MRLLFAGTPEVALPTLEALAASPHELVGVLTRPDAPAGRGRRLATSPVKEWALAHGLPVLQPASLREEGAAAAIEALEPDAIPVVAYGALVPPALLDLPPHGWVNLHFSLLPAWRGAAPVQHALLHGDEITGASTFRIEEGLDTGPVYGTLTETVRPDDTAGTLLGRLAAAGAGLLVATLDGLGSGQVVGVPQAPDGVSLAPRLTTEDGRVRWSHSAVAVDRRIRACTPGPGAWSMWSGARMKLGPVRPEPGVGDLAPGEIAAGRHEVLVGTATHAVRLGEVAPAGRRPMPAADWARGARPDGTRFEDAP